MIKKLKKKILETIKLLGYDLKGNKKIIQHNNFDAIHSFLLNLDLNNKEKVILDVGAHLGQSIERFKKLSKNYELHSFEPTPDIFEKLVNKYKDNSITINQLCLGDEIKTSKFNAFKNHKINSLIDIDQNTKFAKSRTIMSGSEKDDFIKSITIQMTTLDDYCKKNEIKKINLLKIDTQGSEDKVLAGAAKMLSSKSIDVIELELVLGFAYKKTLSFYEIEKILNENYYKLLAIGNSGNVISFSNFQTDLIYVKEELFEKIRELHYKNVDIPGIMNSVNKKHPYSY